MILQADAGGYDSTANQLEVPLLFKLGLQLIPNMHILLQVPLPPCA